MNGQLGMLYDDTLLVLYFCDFKIFKLLTKGDFTTYFVCIYGLLSRKY